MITQGKKTNNNSEDVFFFSFINAYKCDTHEIRFVSLHSTVEFLR